MDYIIFATVIVGSLIGLFSFSYGIFSGMVNRACDALDKSVKDTNDRIDKLIEERAKLVDTNNTMIQHLREEISNRPSYEYLDKHLVRKEVLQLQFENILIKLDDLGKRLESILKNGQR